MQRCIWNTIRGSPPLARGIPSILTSGLRCPRITPACAGNTNKYLTFCEYPWDHPRLRGEYFLIEVVKALVTGSPPLARGIPVIVNSLRNITGITPACAGNTVLDWKVRLPKQDHPRLRGEYYWQSDFTNVCKGSPPLARGIRHAATFCCSLPGITPACAGNTSSPASGDFASWDHPRLRGEYTKKNPIFTAFSQSLPLNFI